MSAEELQALIDKQVQDREAAATVDAGAGEDATGEGADPAPESAPASPAEPEVGKPYQTDKGWAIKLDTGESFEAASPEDLVTAIGSAKGAATRAMRQREAENAELRNKVAQSAGQETETQTGDPSSHTATQANQGQFDQQHYYDTFEKDPLAAQRYLMEHSPEFQEIVDTSNVVRNLLCVSAFHQMVNDFPRDDQAVAEKLMNHMVEEQIPMTPTNMKGVWDRMLAAGEAQPFTGPPAGAPPPLPAGTTEAPPVGAPPPEPPPSTDDVTPSPGMTDEQARSMPLDQLREQINKMGREGGGQ